MVGQVEKNRPTPNTSSYLHFFEIERVTVGVEIAWDPIPHLKLLSCLDVISSFEVNVPIVYFC